MQQRHNATLIFFLNRAVNCPFRKPEHMKAQHLSCRLLRRSLFVSEALLQVSDSQAAVVSTFLFRNVPEGSFPSLPNILIHAI